MLVQMLLNCQASNSTINLVAARDEDPFSISLVEKVPMRNLLAQKLVSYTPPKHNPIVVVIPSYNNMRWYKRNLASVYAQDYDNYTVIYVDDASPDNTGDAVEKYIQLKGQEKRTTLIRNKVRQGACANWYTVVNSLPPEAIVVNLDGDDWLAKPTVLSLINKLYNKHQIFMTYGSCQRSPYEKTLLSSYQIPQKAIKKNNFRGWWWATNHLRTFKAGLFQRIKKEDFLYEEKFLPTSCDVAFMWPMLEMSGIPSKTDLQVMVGTRSLYIPDILYIHNHENPINDRKVARKEQIFFARYLAKKKKYEPLPLGTFF